MTRLKKHAEGSYLTVVSCADEFSAYGKSWPVYLINNNYVSNTRVE